MACSGQIESHVALVMDARNRIREADDTSLSRVRRLQLLCDACNLVHGAMNLVGRLPNLKDMLAECSTKFLEVPR
jgi:hypothetical protein